MSIKLSLDSIATRHDPKDTCACQKSTQTTSGRLSTSSARYPPTFLIPHAFGMMLKLRKVLQGKFRWLFRRRLRVTLIGEKIYEIPIELHDQQLQHRENRFIDCLQEQHKSSPPSATADNSIKQRRVLPVTALNEVTSNPLTVWATAIQTE